MKLLIEKADVIYGDGLIALDILCEDGKIKKIFSRGGADCKADVTIDAGGLVAAPGLVDMHCHLREPGYEHKETIETGCLSASAGGFTSIACMPNTKPAADCPEVIKYIIERAKFMPAEVYPIGGLSKNLEGKELTNADGLKKAGAVALSDDGNTLENPLFMRRAMLEAKRCGLPVISHCEEPRLVDGGAMNEGEASRRAGVKGNPRSAEEVIIARDIVLSAETGAPLHIAHVSTRFGVELVRFAKREGLNLTAETCPHYFSLTDEDLLRLGSNAKMNPPLREENDVRAVIDGLCDGTIDAIATDHAPHDPKSKSGPIESAANGIVGFETALALGITYLVKTGRMSLPGLFKKMSDFPARILGLSGKGEITPGADADIVIFDPGEKFKVQADRFFSKSKNTPYDGMTLYGAVKYTIKNGKVVFEGGRHVGGQAY